MSYKNEKYYVGVDIGGTKILAILVNSKFEVIAREKKKTKVWVKGAQPEIRIVETIKSVLDSVDNLKIEGIGLGVPGPVDHKNGVVVTTPNIGLENFPLGDIISEEFSVPSAVDNDVNLGTFAEWVFSGYGDAKHVLGVFPGTGIGGGLIINRKILHGASGGAGEIGHFTVQLGGPLCGCGKRGCLEALASRIAIVKEVIALILRGECPYLAERIGTDASKLRSSIIAEAIENGEKKVEEIVRKSAYLTGVAIANAINLISPNLVILGGGLIEALGKIYLEEIQRAVKEHAMPFLRRKVEIVVGKLGDDAVAMGGALLISKKLEKE
ncbi:MAG: ROK family protein [Candidatus Hydrogenedentes bacterium]|nr:ROK family protein [Candidatus Hydrogenedentota bacterium]